MPVERETFTLFEKSSSRLICNQKMSVFDTCFQKNIASYFFQKFCRRKVSFIYDIYKSRSKRISASGDQVNVSCSKAKRNVKQKYQEYLILAVRISRASEDNISSHLRKGRQIADDQSYINDEKARHIKSTDRA